jgi:hypothetical protein
MTSCEPALPVCNVDDTPTRRWSEELLEPFPLEWKGL